MCIKKIIKKIISNKNIAINLQKIVLNLHTQTYNLSGILASSVNDGIHPKHRIIKYKEWFTDHIEKGWVVLDVGCNTGMMPEVISKKAKFVYGIELEEKYIKEAIRKRAKDNIKFICADAIAYDYSKLQAIDCVTLSNVLEHIEDRVEFLVKLIQQIRWNNNKRFLIRVPMIDREWIVIYKKELGLEYRLDRTHFTEYTFIQFKNELNKVKIDILNYYIRFGEIYAVCEAK